MTRTAIAQGDLPLFLARLDNESRDLALFLIDSGARLSEALACTQADVGSSDGRASVPVTIHGVKGGGERIAFLTTETAQRVRNLAPNREIPVSYHQTDVHAHQKGCNGNQNQLHLFPRSRRWYQRQFERAGFDARSLRHTFVTSMFDNGADLISVMMLAGHVKADTTRGYWDFTEERLHTLARSIATSLPRARRRAHRFMDLRDGRLDP